MLDMVLSMPLGSLKNGGRYIIFLPPATPEFFCWISNLQKDVVYSKYSKIFGLFFAIDIHRNILPNFEKTGAAIEQHILFYKIYIFRFSDSKGMQNKI